ncbi:unnamed protein product [Clonostachys rosea]|uniref:Protein kinase domain-containing protein n=1 Tax=Bionectria ochroleuca TaxID=29856 RepID=A0ABY6UYZ2_BIOOC|nr:unnamed protein product [Clonostachys rosea]
MAELPLAIVGVGIAVPALGQFVVSLGKAALDRVGHSDDEYWRKVKLIIETAKLQTQDILQYLDRLGENAPEVFLENMDDLFQVVRNILERLLPLLPTSKPGAKSAENTNFSAQQKKKINKAVSDIEQWNVRLLYRAMSFRFFTDQQAPNTPRLSNSPTECVPTPLKRVEWLRESVASSLDRAKNESKLLVKDFKERTSLHQLRESTLWLVTPCAGGQSFLMEYRRYSDDAHESHIQRQREIVRDIAGILRQADPAFMGLLYCDGFLDDPLQCRFALRFPIPGGFRNPRTLLDLLTDPDNKSGTMHPLDHRIALAKSIVTAVFVLHSANLVHKQIRPDNIVIFEDSPTIELSTVGTQGNLTNEKRGYPYSLGKPFIVGFDNVRKADAASLMVVEKDWKKNLYLDPARHRLQEGDEFQMQHDLYSLGVVLLEIAFWSSFQNKDARLIGRKIWKDTSQKEMKGPESLKKTYISLAKAVPVTMGQKYADIVMLCITGLESAGDGLKRLEDEDGITVKIRYILEIISKIEEINL